jgi:uncharacterized protein
MMNTKQPTDAALADSGLNLVAQAWENREGPAVLATVDAAKTPNAIYVGENYFHKTRANITSGTKGAILFLTKERKSFQVKGPLSYHTEGPIFENMQSWHDPKYPGVAATLLRVEEAYNGAEKLL